MRAFHIAERLAAEHEVRLLTTSPYCEVNPDSFSALAAGPAGLAEAEAWSDIMVLQGYVTYHHPVLAESRKIIVFDVYDPLHLETLALTTGTSSQARDDHVRLSVDVLNRQLERADFLLCASERQRDLFLGQLCALGRANALTYDEDPSLRKLIDVVPFGLPDKHPSHRKRALRGVVPGIGPADDVLVWAGGVYNWFDPLTLIRAVAGLAERRPTVRLYFMGLRHPNPDVPEMQVANDARALATELGVAGKHVFFNEGWVDYSERENYLLEATLGVTMHFDSAETRFSFRTRALDYLWAALPVVTTAGDSFAELVQAEGLGAVVPAADPGALEEALARLLSDREFAEGCRARAAAVRERFRWSVVLEPLVRYCRDPRPAPDLARAHEPPPPPSPVPVTAPSPSPAPAPSPSPEPALSAAAMTGALASGPGAEAPAPAMSLMQLARHHYREGGLVQVAKRGAAKARRMARRKP
jgi:glycosyltransferase involved in cell wall biosynthesis